MAKKVTDAFAMSDNDEFIDTKESSSEEGGDDANDDSGDSEGSGEETLDNNDESGESGDDGSDDTGDDGGAEGSGEEGEGSEDGEGEGAEGDEGSEGDSGSSKDDEGDKGSGEEGEGDDSSGEGEEEQDFFGDLGGEESEGSGEESPAVSFKEISNALDITLENDTQEEFAEKVKSKIEEAKQQVNLDEFDPEARRLVAHLNKNGGKLGNFFVNPTISSLQNVLSIDAEDKVKAVRRSDLSNQGGTAEEIDKQIDEELNSMSATQIVQAAGKIDQDANKLIADEIEKIVGESEKNIKEKQAQEAETIKKSRENLKNYVHQQDDFLGIKLSDKAKSVIAKDIETGRLDEIVDLTDEEARFAAYMIKQSGSRIRDQFVKQLAEKSREGYNKATNKHLSKLHKTKSDAASRRAGHEEASGGKKNFENWGDLDI